MVHEPQGASPSIGLFVADLDDPIILARMIAIETPHSLALVRIDDPMLVTNAETPVAIVLDLDTPGAVDRIVEYRRRWPSTLLAGSIRSPDMARRRPATRRTQIAPPRSRSRGSVRSSC